LSLPFIKYKQILKETGQENRIDFVMANIEKKVNESVQETGDLEEGFGKLTRSFCQSLDNMDYDPESAEQIKKDNQYSAYLMSPASESTGTPAFDQSVEASVFKKNQNILVAAVKSISTLPMSHLLTVNLGTASEPKYIMNGFDCDEPQLNNMKFYEASKKFKRNLSSLASKNLDQYKLLGASAKKDKAGGCGQTFDSASIELLKMNPGALGTQLTEKIHGENICNSLACYSEDENYEEFMDTALSVGLFVGGAALSIASFGSGTLIAAAVATAVTASSAATLYSRSLEKLSQANLFDLVSQTDTAMGSDLKEYYDSLRKEYGDQADQLLNEAAMEMGMGIVDAFPLILKAMKSTKAAFVLPKGTKVKTASQSVSSKTSKYIDDEIEALSKNSSSVSDSQLRTMAKNDEHFEFLKGFRNSCKGVRSEMCDEFHKGLVVCSICSTCK
jgi:hypothetical protein